VQLRSPTAFALPARRSHDDASETLRLVSLVAAHASRVDLSLQAIADNAPVPG
jgi:hypothetical protein